MGNDLLLNNVKGLLMLTGNFHDNALNLYINEALSFMESAGVDRTIAEGAPGVVAGIVKDLMTGEAGKGEISPYWKQRVIQLSYARANT